MSLRLKRRQKRKYFSKSKIATTNPPIMYLESRSDILLRLSPSFLSPRWVFTSSRHSDQAFMDYAYFLIFANLGKRELRYGVYLRCKQDLLELKLTLYSHTEYPVHVQIKILQITQVSQMLFEGQNFNFFFPWKDCKNQTLNVRFSFVNGAFWEFPLNFISALLV